MVRLARPGRETLTVLRTGGTATLRAIGRETLALLRTHGATPCREALAVLRTGDAATRREALTVLRTCRATALVLFRDSASAAAP
ncbi:hypothetical protein FHX34_104478 [Actinoplanes teichomyceticus]|uniref:Uncharacterized protein n=1 Tax=Actinoplanes teichomyceticus TaxID=1867 RepID=A0A561VRH6_ACTTI|nr:hypothetical protein FHX34_104478 [Actinoplanes teichomyceticus]